ncbi:MAG TPA: WD40 repeat domain-containing protein, partial [Bryobacteraceae bacterium]
PVASLRGRFDAAALSPDNRHIAVISRGTNLSLHVIGKNDAVWSVGQVVSIAEVEFSGDGSKIVTLGWVADVWDAARGTKIWSSSSTFPFAQAIQSGFTPDGRYWNFLLEGGTRFQVEEYPRTTGEGPTITPTIFPDTKVPSAMQPMRKGLSADGTLVAMTDRRTVSVWRLPTGELAIPSQSLPQNPPVIDYVFNDSVTKMLISSATSARVWDLAKNRFQDEIQIDFGIPPKLMALSPRGDVAAMSLPDGTIVLYQGPNFSHSRRFKIAKRSAASIKFSTDGTLFYALYSYPIDYISGVYLWPVDALDLSAGSTWTQLTQSLQAFGKCLTPAVRQEIFGEKAEAALDNYNRCESSK